MEKQVIITIGHESGSGGLEIARKLGARLGVSVYEKNIFKDIGEHFDIDTTELENFDEKPRDKTITRRVKGNYNSPEEQVVELQREFIKDKAEEGKSFIILGRCGIKALLDFPCLLICVFVEADTEFKLARIMAEEGYTESHRAMKHMKWVDTRRCTYHDQFCHVKWGDRSSYDIVLKSNKLGIDGTVDLLESYVRLRMA